MRCGVSLGLCIVLVFTSLAIAELTPREAQWFCVDIALIKGGVELRGAVLSRDESELRMAVQRRWLTAKYPAMIQQIDQDAAEQQAASRVELKQRIEAWKVERSKEARLIAVLNRELGRVDKAAGAGGIPASQFVVVVTPTDRVRRVYTAPEASRQISKIAWREQIANVEETTFGLLKTAVEKQAPDWQTAVVDLSDRLPTGQPQSEDEWAARQAVFEYEYCAPLDFQGTGSLVFQVGEGAAKPDMIDLFTNAAGDALPEGFGGDLGFEIPGKSKSKASWQATAIEKAKSLDRRGFRITRVPQITGEGPATVTVSFFARMKNGDYREVWSNETTTDPATIKPEELDRVQQDPQVQEILKFANALSIGNDAHTAVRFGAAVQTSLQESDRRFFEFRQRYNNTLDGPQLRLPTP